MAPISNAEKQDRYRKKEHLSRQADIVFQLWQGSIGRFQQGTPPEEVRQVLNKIIELPPNWSDEDFEHAKKKLGQYQLELNSSTHQLANDVNGHFDTAAAEFKTTPNPLKYIADNKAAIAKTQNLATHLISALSISSCNDIEKSAAIMEAVRFIGRSLVNSREIRRSHATAICLTNIGPQYDRPNWFIEQLSETLTQNLSPELAHELGQVLISMK